MTGIPWEFIGPIALALAAAPLVFIIGPAYAVQRFVCFANAPKHDTAAELVVIEASINHLNTRVDAIYNRVLLCTGEE